jgi:hypothetical protein
MLRNSCSNGLTNQLVVDDHQLAFFVADVLDSVEYFNGFVILHKS